MDVVHAAAELRSRCNEARAGGSKVVLVPTMGALHAGHLSLVEKAKEHGDFVVLSIFVNPTQFGPNEDLDRYPKTLQADVAASREAGAQLVFAPSADAMYLPGDEARVRVSDSAAHLCGARRPGHFEGVCTVVAKLFNLVGPCAAVFGRKDFQQLRVIQRMVADLMMPVEVVGSPIVREPDGLAMSSRNAYLSASQRKRALVLSQALSRAVELFDSGERSPESIRALARKLCESQADSIDYVEVVDEKSVVPLAPGTRIEERAVVAIAVHVGPTRLIDNVILGSDCAPAKRAIQ
jgi:pantoate--beta-alanine ligase